MLNKTGETVWNKKVIMLQELSFTGTRDKNIYSCILSPFLHHSDSIYSLDHEDQREGWRFNNGIIDVITLYIIYIWGFLFFNLFSRQPRRSTCDGW